MGKGRLQGRSEPGEGAVVRRRRFACLAAATLALLVTGVGDAVAAQRVDVDATGGKAHAVARPKNGGGFPFSGLDLALLTAGAAPLLLLGVTVRRRRAAAKVKPAQRDSLTLA
jgi:hypothetical protein